MKNRVPKAIYSTERPYEAHIHTQCKELADAYILNGKNINPNIVSRLVSLLISSEQNVGGPYKEEGVDVYITNYAINELAKLIGIELKNIEAFTYASRPSHLRRSMVLKNLNSFFLNIKPEVKVHKRQVNIHNDHVYELLLRDDVHIPLNYRAKYRELIQKIQQFDKNGEISKMANYFNDLLKRCGVGGESVSICDDLDKANVLAWAAYIIYDDLIDEGSGLSLVPVANIMMRKSYAHYIAVASSFEPNKLIVNDHFDTVDTYLTSSSEVLSPSRLYLKSIGHVLGIKLLWGRSSNGQDVRLDAALHHFLNAKQLCDDMKDWEDDYNALNETYVTQSIRNFILENPQARISEGGVFWRYILPDCIKIANTEIEISISYFLEIFGNEMYESLVYKEVLRPIKEEVLAIEKEYSEKKAFLKALYPNYEEAQETA